MFVIVQCYREVTGNDPMDANSQGLVNPNVSGVTGPFNTREEAEAHKETMDFPSPEWVYVRKLQPVV